jgi:ABC-type nitrate/sulfonate/bicarbonate transport system substrate-binding protein
LLVVLKKRNLVIIAVIVLIIAAVLSSFVYLNSPKPYTGKMKSIDVAYSPFESLALFWVAQEKGFFSQNALNITVHSYNSGAAALSGVINGEANIAVGTSEFPLVIRALNHESIQTIGTISKSNFVYLVARADRCISAVSDLKGKTIGTTFGTIAHYYLGRFLVLNGLKIEDVTLVDLKTPTDWVNAVVNGSIDAVATAQPYANSAKEGLGANAVVRSINSNQPQFTQAVATNKWIADHPELCSSFLRALNQAEKFVASHPTEAKAIVKQQMNFTDAYMETVWAQNQYSLSLDPALIQAMESEARWLIGNNLTNQTTIPDFINYVYTNGLASVKPESMTISP